MNDATIGMHSHFAQFAFPPNVLSNHDAALPANGCDLAIKPTFLFQKLPDFSPASGHKRLVHINAGYQESRVSKAGKAHGKITRT